MQARNHTFGTPNCAARSSTTWRSLFNSLTCRVKIPLNPLNPHSLIGTSELAVFCSIWRTMEAGLSSRVQRILNDLLPRLTASAPPAQYNPSNANDLSIAQNEVLRPELLEFFKSTIEDKATSKVRACRMAYCSYSVLIQRTGVRPTRPYWRGHPTP